MARSAGSTTGEERAALGTLDALDACPATRDALAAGEVSMVQAREIASVPEYEAELLDLARTSSARTVKDAARKRRLEGIDPEELFGKQHAAREFVHWNDDLGMIRFRGALPPSVGVSLREPPRCETDREWRAAKRDRPPRVTCRTPPATFVRMFDGTGTGKGRSADLVIVQDLRASAAATPIRVSSPTSSAADPSRCASPASWPTTRS
jgi:hypothetical protein